MLIDDVRTPGEDVQILSSDAWTPEGQAVDGAWRVVFDPRRFPGENPLMPGIPPVKELLDRLNEIE